MTPLAMFGLGVPELLIILAVVLLLFGGSRLAGLGKSTGRALKEFKEETKGLKPGETPPAGLAGQDQLPPTTTTPTTTTPTTGTPYQQPPFQQQPPATGPNPSENDLRKDV